MSLLEKHTKLAHLFKEYTTPELTHHAITSRIKHHAKFKKLAITCWGQPAPIPSDRWIEKIMKSFANYVADRLMILHYFTYTLSLIQETLRSSLTPLPPKIRKRLNDIEELYELLETYTKELERGYAVHSMQLAARIGNEVGYDVIGEILIGEVNWIAREAELVWVGGWDGSVDGGRKRGREGDGERDIKKKIKKEVKSDSETDIKKEIKSEPNIKSESQTSIKPEPNTENENEFDVKIEVEEYEDGDEVLIEPLSPIGDNRTLVKDDLGFEYFRDKVIDDDEKEEVNEEKDDDSDENGEDFIFRMF